MKECYDKKGNKVKIFDAEWQMYKNILFFEEPKKEVRKPAEQSFETKEEKQPVKKTGRKPAAKK